MSVSIPPEYFQKIRFQSERDYPNEACGILVGPKDRKELVTGIYPCQNVQDQYHTQDPVSFPRTARTAYFIDPRDLLRIQKEAREKHCETRVIYHSHVDAGAYFSEEDQRVATSEGRPAYPGVVYLVLSVRNGKTGEMTLFHWSEKAGRFVESEVRVSEDKKA